MSKFKVGDKVESANVKEAGIGVVTDIRGDGYIGVKYPTWYGYCVEHKSRLVMAEANPEGPVRTVTRREVVGGVYGDVGVSVHPDGEIQIEIRMLTKDAKRVLSAAMILSQIAEALDKEETTK